MSGDSLSVDCLRQLGENEVVRCDNPDYPEMWFYDVDSDSNEVVRYHSEFGFEGDTIPTLEQVESSINSEVVDVEIVDVEVLEEHQRKADSDTHVSHPKHSRM